jgi:hypothetical protein
MRIGLLVLFLVLMVDLFWDTFERWLLVLVTLCYSVWCVPSEKIVCHKIGPPWVPMGPHGPP